MNILQFKPKTAASSQAKPPKKRKAVLTVERIPKKQQKAGANFESGLFLGRLVIEGHEFCLDDGNPLGILAHICNVSAITIAAPIGPEPITLRASRGFHREIELLEDFDEKTFLKRVHTGMYMSAQSSKNSRDTFDWWSSGPFQAALLQVPENMRINASLQRGVYDESGQAMTAAQIAWRAKWERMMGMLKEPEKADIGKVAIPWEHVVRMRDPHEPVAINGPAYVAVQKMLLRCGFPRMPQTYAELVKGHDFCERVSMNRNMMKMGDGTGFDWLQGVVRANEKYKFTGAALMEACLREDAIRIAELHAQSDWLAALAQSYEEEGEDNTAP